MVHSKKLPTKKDKYHDKNEYELNEAADFETAITATGFGWFNILLLLVGCPAAIASVFETAVVSYVLPSAECDLGLDLLNKGVLNAVTYSGMIISAIAWGYLADTRGRKKILVWGFLADVLCVLTGALSQNIVQLMVAKFIGGFVICGPFAVLMTYLTEFHNNKYRSRVLMLIGVMFSMASMSMPLLAVLILPNDWEFYMANMKVHSWHIYLATCSLPALVSGLCFIFFPESPRFLMSQGRTEEAMAAFRLMYSMNTGKSKAEYPITRLLNEVTPGDEVYAEELSMCTVGSTYTVADDADSETTSIKGGSPFRALFRKPFLGLSLRVYSLNFCILLGQNTMRLWLPQLFATFKEVEQLSVDAKPSMCSILEYSVNKTGLVKESTDICEVVITPSSYFNNIIVAAVGFLAYLLAGVLINAVGNKQIQITGLLTAGACGIALYWSDSTVSTLIITALYSCMGSISATSAVGTSAVLFPTSLRTMIISVALMFGRIGSIMGNILFPVFMSFGCIPPFLMVGGVMFAGSIISSFLPNTKKGDLK